MECGMTKLDDERPQGQIEFPDFVGDLIDGVFNAIVEASIRQMEAFADLLAVVAAQIDQFTDEKDDDAG